MLVGSLTDVDKRYIQNEKEVLGIVRACEGLHMNFYGADFQILTDHKALDFIYSKSQVSAKVNRHTCPIYTNRYQSSKTPSPIVPLVQIDSNGKVVSRLVYHL